MTMNDRILVVDDEAVLRNNLAKYLRLQGYEVETAGSTHPYHWAGFQLYGAVDGEPADR